MSKSELTRRRFLATSAAAGGGVLLPAGLAARSPSARDRDLLKVGLIGCGGRGTGAAAQALRTSGDVRLVAMGDMFEERITSSLRGLQHPDAGVAERVDVDAKRRFVGPDAFRAVIDAGVDVVILASPPHFRPAHFEAAVAAGKHVFLEKPVAVDGPGIRQVLAAAQAAKTKGLSVVSGLQRQHENGYVEAMARVHDGAIGDVVAARCYWNMGSLWKADRTPQMSDFEWQVRNWLYFTWLSGDHIVEQHVHNIDVVCWAKQAWPVRCHGVGGRQVRTDPKFGHIYDHHSVHYEFADGSWAFSMCRQIDNCWNSVSEHLIGTHGKCDLRNGAYAITGANAWTFKGVQNDPYQSEQDFLFASIRSGKPAAEGERVAKSTLAAIMGRMATYTGKRVTFEQALGSTERLGPERYEFGPVPLPSVPMPGSA